MLSPILSDYKDIILLLKRKQVYLQNASLDKQGEHILSLLTNLIADIDGLNFSKLSSLTKLNVDKETLVLALLTSNAGGIIKQLSQVYPRNEDNLTLERKVRLSEQLSLIGDAVLQAAFHTYLSEQDYDEIAILSKVLLKRNISSVEGTYTELAKNLVSNTNLEKLWLSWGIEPSLGNHLKPNEATHSRATMVETLIGALFLQNKFRIIVNFIPDWINLVRQKS